MNVLLLFTDQQRADSIGALGGAPARTPAMDRLCAEGCAFTRAFTPSPICIAARCSLHYGRWASRTGCATNEAMPADDGTSWPARLARAGYQTHAIGKLHFHPDTFALRGFAGREVQEEMPRDPQRDDYLALVRANGFAHLGDPHGLRSEWLYLPQPSRLPAALHPTQWVGDRAVAFVRAQSRARPWALMASFIHPHPPFAPPEPWHLLHRGVDMPPPVLLPDAEAHHTWHQRQQNRYLYRDQGLDLRLVQQLRAAYHACVSFVDHQIGRILAALAEAGTLDDTLVLLASDHGEYLGDLGCFGKCAMHGAAARIPLVARLPGTFAPGTRCDRPASLVDVLPTICGLAGADASGSDGVRLDRLAAGQEERDAVFAQHGHGATADYAVFTRDRTFWYSAAEDRELAYHDAADPAQTRLEEERPEHAGLRRSLHAHLRGLGVADALDGPDWRRYPPPAEPVHPDAGLLRQDAPLTEPLPDAYLGRCA